MSRLPPGRFNPTLHGARGMLALCVFLFHVTASGAPGLSWQVAGFGHAALVSLQFGVEVFFGISGYVIVGTLGRSAGPGAFLRDRAMRLLPVLWLTLMVLVPLGLFTHQGVFATIAARDLAWVVPANLLPLAGAFPVPVLSLAAWSLSYEVLFYVLAAALWWGKRRWAPVVLAVAAGLIAWHPRAIFFLIGAALARGGEAVILRSPLGRATRAPWVLLAGFFACWYGVEFGGGGQSGTLLDWVGDGRIGLAAIACLLGTLGFAGLVAGRGWLGRLLRTGLLQWLGTLSYSFYLWHIIVIGVAKRGLVMAGVTGPWSQVALVGVCLPVALLIAQASVRYVERGLSGRLRQAWRARADLRGQTV